MERPKRSYAKAIAGFALSRTVSRTDTLSMVAGVFVPALLTVTGVTVADTTLFVAWVVIGAVSGVAVARLIAAPYFIWKEQNARIAALQLSLEEVRSSPKRRWEDRLADQHASDRIAMADHVSRIRAAARTAKADLNIGFTLFLEARPVAERLSVDLNFKSLWLEFVSVTTTYVMKKPVGYDFSEDMNDRPTEYLSAILSHENTLGQQMVYASERMHRFLMTGER